MSRQQNNQNGFSALEALLIIIIVAIIGFVGWYVYAVMKNTDNAYSGATAVSASSSPKFSKLRKAGTTTTVSATTQASITCSAYKRSTTVPAGWLTYTSSKYGYSIAYPSAWNVANSGGAVDNLPILDGVLFTPPGNQGSQYDLYVTQQSLPTAISNWENDVQTKNYNGGLSGGPTAAIVSNTCYTYDGHPAAEIVTQQSDGTSHTYDIEFDVSSNGYLYDFSTSYSQPTSTLSNSTNARVGDVLSVVESLKVN